MTPTPHRAVRAASGHLGRACGLVLLAGLPGPIAAAAPADAAPAPAADPPVGTPPIAAATPAQPYGGQLDHPVSAGLPGDDPLFEIGLLGVGGVNALGLVAAGAVDAWRGPTPQQTRRALVTRTDRGTPSGPRRPAGRERPAPAPRPDVAPRPTGAHRRDRRLRAA